MLEIKRISCEDIFYASNSAELLDAYSKDCVMPDYNPQRQMYATLENSGALHCFGAYSDGILVGFVSVITGVMPHNGKRMATIESLFALPSHRKLGTGDALMSAVEKFASEEKYVVLLYTARVGSPLEVVLSRRPGCKASHTMFTRWL
jgi:GNAT superfamily N-acetyltransferase